MIERTYDAGRVNAVVNDASVRPFVGGDGASEIDLGPVLANRDNVCLFGEHGGFMATWSAPQTYEIHTFILPDGRGRWAYEAAQELLAALRGDFEAKHIWTRVPRDQRNVRRFTAAAGLVPCGEQVCDFGGGPTLYDLFHWRA